MRKIARNRIAAFALIAVIGALFAGPAAAFGQDALSDPSAAQYEPQSQVQGTTTSASNDSVAANSSGGSNDGTGSLPFTGLDVVVLSAVALALIGTGFALRRLSTPRA
jgi:hypothetical protein